MQRAPPGITPCQSVVLDTPIELILGKARIIPLTIPAARMIVGGHSSSPEPASTSIQPQPQIIINPAPASVPPPQSDNVADLDFRLLSPRELLFVGKKVGSMNVVLQSADGRCVVKDIVVTIDQKTLQSKLAELMPEEDKILVKVAENSVVLTGEISDAIKLDEVMNLASAYGHGKKVVNMLRIMTPQQVMLEVKIAEVSKTLLDKLGASVGLNRSGNNGINIDGEKDDGLVRVLAEPNIMAISGQSASFLSGGKIYIPVSQTNTTGTPTITLEEKEFGIGVKFTPTVLNTTRDGNTRINLKMISEVSDLSQTGSPFSTVGGITSVLPSMSVRRADTTVQLNDGQSFVIAGLIKNNITETIKRFPGLGEVPILGTLFRSSEFQNDRTELLFVITPRLVKPLTEIPTLPTDNHVVPSRADVLLNGSLEGAPPAPAPSTPQPAAPAPLPAPVPRSDSTPAS